MKSLSILGIVFLPATVIAVSVLLSLFAGAIGAINFSDCGLAKSVNDVHLRVILSLRMIAKS